MHTNSSKVYVSYLCLSSLEISTFCKQPLGETQSFKDQKINPKNKMDALKYFAVRINGLSDLIEVDGDPSLKQTHQERMYQFNPLPMNRVIQQVIN